MQMQAKAIVKKRLNGMPPTLNKNKLMKPLVSLLVPDHLNITEILFQR